MIDFGKIERWCEAEYLSTNVVKELITRLRQSEKDAARYRWLRDESNYCGVIGPLAFLTDSNGSFCMNEYQCKISLIEESLDLAIDEAMNVSNNRNAQGSQ